MITEFEIRNLSGIVATDRFDKTTVIIGSGSDCDLTLASKSDDTIRLRVDVGDSGARVTCLHDAGIMINRSPVFKKGESSPLRHGDIIRFVKNDLHLTFSYSQKGTGGIAESSNLANDDSAQAPNIAESTSENLAPESGSKEVMDNEILIAGGYTAMWSILREQRRIIVAACIGFLVLLLLVFKFYTVPSDTLNQIEINVVVDEHETKIVDLLEYVRRQTQFNSITIGDITPSVNLNDAIIFNYEQRQISFSPSEADAPNEFPLYLKCLVTSSDSTVEWQQPIVVRCIFNEVEDLPFVEPVRSMQLGLGNTRPISLVIDGFDPDLPQDSLTYTTSKQLPDGATLDPITGAFNWIPSKEQYGQNYMIAIDVTKKTKTNLFSTVEFEINLIDDSKLDLDRKKYEDSLYVVWLQDPTGKFKQPIATTVAIAPGVLATNATLILELQKQVRQNWTVLISQIGRDDVVPANDMLVHGYFPAGRTKYGEGSYQSIMFDVGIIRASEEFIQSFLDVIDAESYAELSTGQDVDLLSVNIADKLQDATEVLASIFTRGKLVSFDTLSVDASAKTPDFSIFEVSGRFPKQIDGAPLLVDGKLVALYSSTFRIGNQVTNENHLLTAAFCLSDFVANSLSPFWVHASKALPQSK
jgi:hypothetical protein